MRSKLGDTMPVDDDRLARVVAALPFLGGTLGAGTIPFPRLSLEQYASLCAELREASPAEREAVLRRYHVLHEASLGALVAHWEARLSSAPEERARLAKAVEDYAAWLRVARARGG